jgi:hypothetical protein
MGARSNGTAKAEKSQWKLRQTVRNVSVPLSGNRKAAADVSTPLRFAQHDRPSEAGSFVTYVMSSVS